jgi:hypothetical protein
MAQTHPSIKGFIAKFETTSGSLTGLALCALCAIGGCMPHVADAQSTAAANPSPITEISVERDCFGCATGSVLVLRRDGTATLTITGKARMGTENSVSTGSVRREDFDELARLALTQGFFDLNDSYEDPQMQDGAWSTTRVVRGTQDKRVFRRDDAGPPALRRLEDAIERVKARTRFVAERR